MVVIFISGFIEILQKQKMQYYLQLMGEDEDTSSLQIVDDKAVPSHLVSKTRITNAPRVQKAEALALLRFLHENPETKKSSKRGTEHVV